MEQITENGIERAIRVAGSQSELARRVAEKTGLPVAQAHVWYWRKAGHVSEQYRDAVAAVTGVPVDSLKPVRSYQMKKEAA